ncbi:MAG: hypothetical protein L0Z53_03505 [Acidobacteriales bacterium]|nr:hypothetical protein [Terriglobales bacterium]
MTEKQKELIQQLLDKTNAKTITWEPTAAKDEFVCTFRGNYTFTITKTTDTGYYGDVFVLVMRDEADREMLTLHSGANSDLRTDLTTLYYAAHNSALKVEEAIDDILEDLRKRA